MSENKLETLSLLRMELGGHNVYFIQKTHVDGDAVTAEDLSLFEYMYEEGRCPSSVFGMPVMAWDNDTDPHGLLEHVHTLAASHSMHGDAMWKLFQDFTVVGELPDDLEPRPGTQ